MKTVISVTLQKTHPDLETILWRTACLSKEHDNDIQFDGLLVRATKSRTQYWTGSASPYEDSTIRTKKYIHPGGRIDLHLTKGMVRRSIIVLFAHELRHIGQFHRGRKKYGVMGWDGTPEDEFERDCMEFEQLIANLMMAGTSTYKGIDASG